MKNQTRSIHITHMIPALLICFGGGLSAPKANAQTVVTSMIEVREGKINVVFPVVALDANPVPADRTLPTTPGKIYRIERSIDLTDWTVFPETIYGFGQNVRYCVGDAPISTQTNLPPDTTPLPSETLTFMVTAFTDGTAVAAWTGLDGSPQKAYVPTLDLTYNGDIMMEVVSGTITPSSPDLPYGLTVWSWSSTKPSSVSDLIASPVEADTLAKLTSQIAWVRSQMTDNVDWRENNPLPPPEPENFFDDHGNPLKEFYRVMKYTVDSNYDGIEDHLQFNSGDVFDMDLDNDGIPNGYDSDIFTNEAALNSVLINEVLYANEFTNADQFNKTEDWIELYNPTSTAIDIGGWFLSDKAYYLDKWEIPAGTTIDSGEFLVVWASKKNISTNGAAFHTNFAINNGSATPPTELPETVSLSKPDPGGGAAILVDAFVPQSAPTANLSAVPVDVSYGRYPTASGLQFGYFILPTPGTALTNGIFTGAHNVQGALGICDPPTFSGSAPGLYTDTTVTMELVPPAAGGQIHITRNATNPTRYSELYEGSMEFDRTKVITAITAKDGYLQSAPISRSFLFTEDIVGTAPAGTLPTDYQGARDSTGHFKGLLRGYPEATHDENYPLVYDMHPGIIAEGKSEILAALAAYPIVSITAPVHGLFDVDAGGLYANSDITESGEDPLGRDWQRFCTFSYLPNGTGGEPLERNAGASMAGASSLAHSTTRKHNWRIRFGGANGASELEYLLFPDTTVKIFKSLIIKNPTHDAWSQNGSWASQADAASYCDEGWVRAAHIAMGHDGARRRWVNLFVNGIYWGPEELTERIDDSFMDEHFGPSAYDVLMPGALGAGPHATDGDTNTWHELLSRCWAVSNAVETAQPPATQQACFSAVEEYLDLENYIDYLICNTFAGNSDWPGSNYRMARRDASGAQFRFFMWDAEMSFRVLVRPVHWVNTLDSVVNLAGVAGPHAYLSSYPGYRQRFSERLVRHFFVDPSISGSGCLAVSNGVDQTVALYQRQMDAFEPLVWCESARWGSLRKDAVYYPKATPYQKSEPGYLPDNPNMGDWERTTAHVLETWLPTRRDAYFAKYASVDLFVDIAPTALASATNGVAYSQTLGAVGDAPPYTYELASGSLPAGLNLSGALLSGTPSVAGTNSFEVGVSSTNGISGMRLFTLIVEP